MNQKRVGQILREAREERKLTVRDVAKETNIALKFIIALETEDYSQFPAETFALGFLKSYGTFLKLETAMLMNLYRGEQIEEAQPPLEELTRPTSSSFSLDRNLFLALGIAGILGLGGYFIYQGLEDGGGVSTEEIVAPGNNTILEKDRGNEIPSQINFVSQSVPENTSVPFILTQDRGISFSVNNQQCRIFIKEVQDSNSSGQNVAEIGFNIFPERDIFNFKVGVGDEVILSNTKPELSSLRRDIRIVAQAVTEKSAKLLVTLSGDRESSPAKQPVGDVPIQVTLFFTKSSYVEFIIDGQMGERGIVSSGDVKSLEAKDRLEIKVGDGGAVEMIQNGKPRAILGKSGKLVKKIFVKTQNPYDSTQFIIKELGE